MGQGQGIRAPGAPGAPGQAIYPITERDAVMAHVPHFLPFEPAVPIGALATGIVDQIISWQDFVCTKIGFTSTTVGFPATAGRWKVQIQDIGASRNFQQEAWNITALVGANSGVSDSAAVDIPVPWVFLEKTTIRVTLEDLTGLGGIPHLLLVGYLTNWQRDATASQALRELNLRAAEQAAEATNWQGR